MEVSRIQDSVMNKNSQFLDNAPDYTSRELTALYRMWLHSPNKSGVLTVPNTVSQEVLGVLARKGVVQKSGDGYLLTNAGVKLLNKIIFATEKSTFEKKAVDVVDVMTVLAAKPHRKSSLSFCKKAFNLKTYKNGDLG